MSNKKENIGDTLIFIFPVALTILISDFLFRLGYIDKNSSEGLLKFWVMFLKGAGQHIILIRIIYVFAFAAYFWLLPNARKNRENSEDDKYKYLAAFIILSIILIYGFIPLNIYNIYIYPILFLIHIPITIKAVASFRDNLVDEDPFATVTSHGENEYSFKFDTDKGPLVENNPRQGIAVLGGAGSGKSVSHIDPRIDQAVQKGYSGYVYDYVENETIATTAFSSLINHNSDMKCWFINFINPEKSHRTNPIHPRYILSSLFAEQIAITLMKNLEKSWIEKTDFWASNAISYVKAIIWRLNKLAKKDEKYLKYCTIPHMISICLSDLEPCMRFLCEDWEVKKIMAPMTEAYEKEAMNQVAGSIASSQLPITKIFNPEIYWVLSGDDFSLDISNKKNPAWLCVANYDPLRDAISPAVSLITSVIMQQINLKGKNKILFCIDELPTLFIMNLSNLPATGRKHGVVTLLGIQDYSQLEVTYTAKGAETIIANMGNQYYGMTNNQKTAKNVSDMLGDYRKKEISYSTNAHGEVTESESFKKERILQPSEIMGQDIGKFTFKVAGGKPPFGQAQFEEFTQVKHEIPSFATPIKTGDPNKDIQILKQMIQENFQTIENDVVELLMPYR